jgi:hypothetical protein
LVRLVGSIQKYFTWNKWKTKRQGKQEKRKERKGQVKLQKKATIKGRRYKEKSSG